MLLWRGASIDSYGLSVGVFFYFFDGNFKIGGVFAMKKQNNMLFMVMSLLCVQMIFAQAMTVSGTVSDAQTGEALLGAQVFVKGTFVGTTTDDNGAFSLDIEAGATLVVNYTSRAKTL